jgi:hypothetical protein
MADTLPTVFDFAGSPVAVRPDLAEAFAATWAHLASPGATLTGAERLAVAAAARGEADGGAHPALLALADRLGRAPGTVHEPEVRAAADVVGDPPTVEAVAVVSMLACVDGTHDALGIERPALPDPEPGAPSGDVADGLKRRRTHLPMPPGSILVALDLVGGEHDPREALSVATYMPGPEMVHPVWGRDPGLDRPQMEVVASRTSWHNDCFY